MGLRMQSLHVSTISTTAPNTISSMKEAKDSLIGLMTDKERLEAELKALSTMLDSVRVSLLYSLGWP